MRALPIRSKEDIARALIAVTAENRWYIERMAKAFGAVDTLPSEWELDSHEADRRDQTTEEQMRDLVEFVNEPSGEPEEIQSIVASLSPATLSSETVSEFVSYALTAAGGHVRKVRTEEGSKRFNLPIGSIIEANSTWKRIKDSAGNVMGSMSKDEHGNTVAVQHNPITGEHHIALYDKHGKPLVYDFGDGTTNQLKPPPKETLEEAQTTALHALNLFYDGQKYHVKNPEYTYENKKNKKVATIPSTPEVFETAPITSESKYVSKKPFVKGKQKTLGDVNLDAKQGHPEHHTAKKTFADGNLPIVGTNVVDKNGNTGTIKQTYQTHSKVEYHDPNLKTKTIANSSLNKHDAASEDSSNKSIDYHVMPSGSKIFAVDKNGEKKTSSLGIQTGVFASKNNYWVGYENGSQSVGPIYTDNPAKEAEEWLKTKHPEVIAQISGEKQPPKVALTDFVTSSAGKKYFGLTKENAVTSSSLQVGNGVVVNKDGSWFATKNGDIIHQSSPAPGMIQAMKEASAWLEQNHPDLIEKTKNAYKNNNSPQNSVKSYSSPSNPYAADLNNVSLDEAMKAAEAGAAGQGEWHLPKSLQLDTSSELGSEHNPVRFGVYSHTQEAYIAYGHYLTKQDRDQWGKKSAFDQVKTYTGGWYSHVNNYLWTGNDGSSSLTNKIGHMDNGFVDKAVATFPKWQILSRGASLMDLSEFGLDHYSGFDDAIPHIGKTFVSKGYKSTSITDVPGLNGSANARFIIKCPPGTKGIYVDGFSNHKGEREIILPRGTKYRLVDVEKRTGNHSHQIFVTLEVVPE